jgi:thiol-disulfide isomerase/thioredoxin
MEDTATGLEIGGPTPVSPQMLGVDGWTHTLDEFGDAKALVVVFIANGCPTVRAYEDRLKDLHEKYASLGVQFVAVNSNNPHYRRSTLTRRWLPGRARRGCRSRTSRRYWDR